MTSPGALRPRVAFIDHCAALSGGEIALLRTIEALDLPSHVVLAEDGPLVEPLRRAGAQVTVYPLPERTRSMERSGLLNDVALSGRVAADLSQYTRGLARLLRDLRPDVVHTNSLKSGFYGTAAARLARIPSVWHLRDRLARDYMPAESIALSKVAMSAVPNTVVVNSHATAETLPRRWKGRAVVVPDPYEPGLTGTAVTDERVEDEILLVGRISPWKGQLLLLDALALVRQNRPGARVRIVGEALFGEDEYAALVVERSRRDDLRGSVEFVGFSDQVERELGRTTIFAHTSTIPEPFGQVVVEALAAGAPVVVPDAGGPAEIVRDGVDGLRYRMGDPASLASAIERLLDDRPLRRRLSENGRQRASDYSPARTRASLLSVYDGILGS